MSSIDRVRYYDGEFLRAFDFSDEQTYHVEMRRRLNRYLHLYGIVQGLQLSEDVQGSPPNDVHQVSILPGMAIDAFGREIYVFAPYTFGDADIVANRIANPGPYDVWLHYDRTPSTPPSSGYGVCNQSNQYTRWAESFSVVLLSKGSMPFTEPTFSDDDSDSGQDTVSILLGTVYVDPSSPTKQFSAASVDKRTPFIGIIAQRIQTPIPYDATQANPPYTFLQQNTALNPPVSLEIEPNIFADQNLVVGKDFDLTNLVNKPPKPGFSTNPAGNVKIAGDLIVQGHIFPNIPDSSGNPQWFELSQYVQQLLQQFLPEFAVGLQQVQVSNADQNAGLVGGTEQIAVKTTRLTNVTSAVAFAYFSATHFVQTEFVGQFTGVGGSALQLVITTPPQANFAPNNQNGTVSVTWQAGPATGTKPTVKCPIDSFTISCVVICFP